MSTTLCQLTIPKIVGGHDDIYTHRHGPLIPPKPTSNPILIPILIPIQPKASIAITPNTGATPQTLEIIGNEVQVQHRTPIPTLRVPCGCERHAAQSETCPARVLASKGVADSARFLGMDSGSGRIFASR